MIGKCSASPAPAANPWFCTTCSFPITAAEAVRARRDMVYAQHQVSWAVERLCELDGARWVYDSDRLGATRRDVMTILTHHAASRQAAMAPYGRMLLTRETG